MINPAQKKRNGWPKMGDLFSPFSPARAETRQAFELAGQLIWDPGIKNNNIYGSKCPSRESDWKIWWSKLAVYYYNDFKRQTMPVIERHISKWETKYYRLGLWLKILVLFAILTFSLNGGAFCESKSIDVVLKYSSSVKIKN